MAQSVSRPSRANCGACHFYGGGGDGVKHGDLDSSLIKPNKKLDVHMGLDGQNFACVRCHSTTLHNIAGRVYTTPASRHRKTLIENDLASKITCESCHSSSPHKTNSKANDHTDKVACQTCHIPCFARINPTKTFWDWSAAGKKINGKPYSEKGPFGKKSFTTKKGRFKWKKNVKPVYFWYNGSMEHITVKDTIDPSQTVPLNRALGDEKDPNSRIFPFKVHMAIQPYDKVNKNMVIPHLFPKNKNDKDAYWKGYDWGKAIEYGQKYAGLEFSGEYDFVTTSYIFPISHMVAPKDNGVACKECHTPQKSRLQNISGVYMPGKDVFNMLNKLGWFGVFAALIGVLLHGIGRFFVKNRKEYVKNA